MAKLTPAAATERKLLDQYCVTCHNQKIKTAGLVLEANCVKYGENYKPEGLIQKYSGRMRFSAFGYLNDDSDQRDGA